MANKEKILITGFSGFVARHFLRFLYENDIDFKVLGVDISAPIYNINKYTEKLEIEFRKMNLLSIEDIKEVCINFKPDYILHLASLSSVSYSWKHPNECFVNNTNIFLNLVTAVRESNISCRILSVGSSEEYGNVSEKDLPLKEEQVLKPINPYAVARVSQEMLSTVFVESYNMNIVLTRSFNHIGPWQDERFVVPSFVNKILKLKKEGYESGKIETGDTSIVRDFIDVRDVVKAYYSLLKKGEIGEVYNVCSGIGRSLDEIISIISEKLQISIECHVNPELVRPIDNKIIIGSAEKIKRATGWEPEREVVQTISDIIDELLKGV